ncbi:MAG TPA: SGNH/GDSL hydrolase family protein [Edaphobacter sp.]
MAVAAFVTTASVTGLYSQTFAPGAPQYGQPNYAARGWDRSADTGTQESLSSWRQALASSNRKVANAVIIGDSIACCVGPQNYENVWTNSLRSYINAQYKQHGSGVIPVGNNNANAQIPPENPPWSLHNNTGQITSLNYGPYQTGVGAFGGVFKLTGNAELTLLVPENHPYKLALYYASSTDSGAGIVVQSEKRSLGVVAKEKSSTLLPHTAVLSLDHNSSTLSFSSASANGSIYIYGAEFLYDDAGVSIHNIAHGYARSDAYGADTANQLAFLDHIPGGIQLAVINLGVNDSIDGTGSTASEYRGNMQNIISYLRQLNPDMSILIFDQISTSPGEAATLLPQSLVREQEQQLAQANRIGYYSPLSSWGDVTTASARGYLTSDGIHPTDLGDRKLANLLEAIFFEDGFPVGR